MPASTRPEARIYVIKTLRHLEGLEVGTRSWWCVERNAQPGEIGVLYLIRKGMTLLFRVVSTPEEREYYCRGYGLATGEIEILAWASKPIHASVLRSDPVLKELPALRRSFQRRSFRLDQPFLTALTDLMGLTPE
jgi:hypothetical protein